MARMVRSKACWEVEIARVSCPIYSVVENSKWRGIPGLERRRSGASASRGRKLARALSKFFAWNIEHRRIAANPCAGIKVETPLPRNRVLSSAEIAAFWKAASRERAEFAAPLKLLLLTGQRLSEVSGMRREELSEDGATWTIPGTRTKNHRAHVVPLSPAGRDLIASMRDGAFVFSTDGRAPVALGSKIKARLDAAMKIAPWRLHDLRRTAVTGMAELGMRPDVIELVVNHVSGTRGGIAGVYNRSGLLAERRAALERWNAHVQGIVSERPAPVVAIRGRQA
jgi:integrase